MRKSDQSLSFMMASSLYETNILNQPSEWKRILNTTPFPSDLSNFASKKKIIFVGIGSSYWAARFAEFLWREYLTQSDIDVTSVQSYDFVRAKYVSSSNDIVVVFSHRGTKSYSIQALEFAKRWGATTILITGIGSPNHDAVADFRIETCAQENCGAFTVSLTSAIIRIIQWLGLLFDTHIVERFKEWIETIELPCRIQVPRYLTNLVIVGDLIREVVAHEVCLKISETSYLPVRSFGLEEFLHGPRVTIDKQSSLLAFTSIMEPRREDLIKYVEAIGSEVINIDEESFKFKISKREFSWLAQLLWGQQLALELSKKLNTNPDTVRGDQSVYSDAKNLLKL